MSTLTCPACGSTRVIGCEVRGVYDGVLYWLCGDCEHKWNRWPEGHYLHQRAEKHMAEDVGL